MARNTVAPHGVDCSLENILGPNERHQVPALYWFAVHFFRPEQNWTIKICGFLSKWASPNSLVINRKTFHLNTDRSLANVWLGRGSVARARDPCMVRVGARGSWTMVEGGIGWFPCDLWLTNNIMGNCHMGPSPHQWIDRMADRHDWKYYHPATCVGMCPTLQGSLGTYTHSHTTPCQL